MVVLLIWYFDYVISVGHTHRYQLGLKKKNQVRSPSPKSRVPENRFGSADRVGPGFGA